MIHRVAQAIAFSGLTGPPSNWPKMWAKLEEHERTYHLATARAAMEAMRQPTAEMVKAGDESCGFTRPTRLIYGAFQNHRRSLKA